MRVADRVCVVTGGGSGIGRALCERFVADGARTVVVVDRDGDRARTVADAIGGVAVEVDVADADALTTALHRIEDDHGPIDLLCNNAGIASGGDPLTTPIDEWQRQWDVNVMSHDRGIRTYLLAPLGVRTPMLGDAADSEWGRLAAGPIREPEEVAQQVTDALDEERFLILTDPIAQEWMEFKTGDPEKWLRGMRRLQARIDAADETGAPG